MASSRRQYKWAYLFTLVRPSTGETVNLVGSTVSAIIMSAMLKLFAEEAGIGPLRRAVLVLDGAGWHTAGDLVVPEGVHLVFLPPYSPELQPAERIWPLINEEIANRTFAELPELMTAIDSRCAHLPGHREEVRNRTCYHWWPAEPPCAA